MMIDQGSLEDETQEQKLSLVLSDFDKLFFTPNPCHDAFDKINYNEGKEANPFDKIVKYYGREKDVFFFISMLRNKNQSDMMMDTMRQKCDEATMAKFIERVNIYLQRIKSGEFAAKECLESFDNSSAFFNGPHVGDDRNVYENLNINLTKPRQFLEINSVFNFESQRMLEEKGVLKRIKIYNDGKRMATILRDGKERNVSFRHGSCLFVVSLASESENDPSHAIFIIAINSGKINNVEVRIGGKCADPREVIHLSKEIHSVILSGKSIFDALEKFLKEEKSIYNPTIDSSFLEVVTVKSEQQEYVILT